MMIPCFAFVFSGSTMRRNLLPIILLLASLASPAAGQAPPDSAGAALPFSPEQVAAARIKLWIWDREDPFLRPLEFRIAPQIAPQWRRQFDLNLRFSAPLYPGGYGEGFQHQSRYLMDEAQWEMSSEGAKGSNPLMLSSAAVSRAMSSQSGKNVRLPGELVLHEQDVQLLSLLWEAPGRTPAELYLHYVQTRPAAPLSFSLFRRTLDSLDGRGLLRSRAAGQTFWGIFRKAQQQYSAKFNREMLLRRIEEELARSDALLNPNRHFELLRMKARLENDWEAFWIQPGK